MNNFLIIFTMILSIIPRLECHKHRQRTSSKTLFTSTNSFDSHEARSALKHFHKDVTGIIKSFYRSLHVSVGTKNRTLGKLLFSRRMGDSKQKEAIMTWNRGLGEALRVRAKEAADMLADAVDKKWDRRSFQQRSAFRSLASKPLSHKDKPRGGLRDRFGSADKFAFGP